MNRRSFLVGMGAAGALGTSSSVAAAPPRRDRLLSGGQPCTDRPRADRQGARPGWRGQGGVYGQKGTAAFLVTAGDVAFEGLTVKGPRRGKYAVSEGLIVATGTSSNARISGVRIQGCRLLDSGSAGILLIFVDRFEIVGNHIQFIGSEAVETISCSHGRVHGNHVHDIGPGVGNVISGMAAPDKYGYGVLVEGNMPNVSVIANTLTKGAGVAPSVGLKALLQTTNPIFVGTNNFEEAATAPYQLTSARDGHRPNRIVPRTGDPTPSVAALQSGGAVVFQNGAESLAVKDFRGGIDGQVIHVSNTGPGVVSIDRGGNFALASASWRGAPYQTLSLLRVGSKWCEIGRSTSNA